MAIYSDMNGFPESGFPVLADMEDRMILNTLYYNPLKHLGYKIDVVGNSRLLGALVLGGALSGVTTLAMGGALSGVTTIAANNTATLSSATAPLALTGASAILSMTGDSAVISMTGQNASIGTNLTRIRRGFFRDLEITNAPTVNGDPLMSRMDCVQCSNVLKSYSDGKVAQTITNGTTTSSPSQDAVYDALALKADIASPSFTGTVTLPTRNVLPTDGQVKLTIPTTDGHATGNITDQFNSGYSSSAVGDLVYLDSSSTWQKADKATSAATYSGLLGIALEVKASGNALKVALPGSFVYATGFPALTIGAPVYMGTAGALVVTQPSAANDAIRIIGWGIHSDKLFFNPSPDYIVHI